MNEIKINLDNLTAEEREQLMKLVEKGGKPEPKVWEPKEGEKYWFLNSWSEVKEVTYFDDTLSKRLLAFGNLFPTREAANEERKRKVMIARWKRLSIEAGEDDNSWDGEHHHWAVSWDYRGKRFQYFAYESSKYMNHHFPSADSLKAAIAELGEENVKKYILGVRE